MKPQIKLAEAKTSDGSTLALFTHDGKYSIHVNNQGLMHSQTSYSEIILGELGSEKLSEDDASRVMIGGLGLGYTLKSVLSSSGEHTQIDTVELMPEIIDWNKTHLKELNESALEDPRVNLIQEDVIKVISQAKPETYNAIMLDVDNGPEALVAKGNANLYNDLGIRAVRSLLKPDGRVIYWSCSQDKKFEERLRQAGYKVKVVPAKIYKGAKRASYWLFVADLAGGAPES
ncbi:spermine synthase [Puniceicoccaceae bacterium K14]|nr:spermine synthase [Puniceicoccaceae bacterium K14]